MINAFLFVHLHTIVRMDQHYAYYVIKQYVLHAKMILIIVLHVL